MNKNENLIGKRFGRLVVMSFAEFDKTGKSKWLCKCDCGKEKIIYEQSFCRGATKSCGCYAKEASRRRMSEGWADIITKEYLQEHHIENKLSLRQIAKKLGCSLGCVVKYMEKYELAVNDSFYDIAGKKFGRLTVIDLSHTSGGRTSASYWNVECDCGVKKVVQGKTLVRHSVISCGCWNREKGWKGCRDLSGGYWSTIVKGAVKRNIEMNITIEDAWNVFQKQDEKCALSGRKLVMDRSYSSKTKRTINGTQTASFDRIDSEKGYTIDNVQWIYGKLNKMKMDLGEEEFIALCKDVANHK